MPFTRAIVIVLDSVGVGELPDASAYGDEGSNTLGHIAERVSLSIPTFRALGLGKVVDLRLAPAAGPAGRSIATASSPPTAVGRMVEASAGKDSVTGHWELMGVVLDKPFPVFPDGFSVDLVDEFARQTGRPVIGNVAASGTRIINELGPEHLRTGAFIVYTSADSVFQIAAHEDVVPLSELYRACEIAYRLACDGLGMGRVIARPFVGVPGSFTRTKNRRDYARPPSGETLLDRLSAGSRQVVAIGKIADLFAGRGITRAVHSASDEQGMDCLITAMEEHDAGLLFVNLVDFDTEYGHRNDVEGYARNLERFDARLAALLPRLRDDDLLVVTADHGNDPSTPSTDHSREFVPLLVIGHRVRPAADLGTRATFADVGQTLAEWFDVAPLPNGTSFLREILA
jgi:phosphopentomutase